MSKKKNGFFVPNQGGFKKSAKSVRGTALVDLPAASQPLWEDVGGPKEPCPVSSTDRSEKIQKLKGERLW